MYIDMNLQPYKMSAKTFLISTFFFLLIIPKIYHNELFMYIPFAYKEFRIQNTSELQKQQIHPSKPPTLLKQQPSLRNCFSTSFLSAQN